MRANLNKVSHATEETLASLTDKIAALRSANAQSLDPVRFQYLESLARRAGEQRQSVANILAGKLQQALDDYPTVVKVTPKRQPTSIESPLAALTQILAAQTDRPDRSANGLALDEYLRHQEAEVLAEFCSTDPAEPPTSAHQVAGRPPTGLESARLFRQHQAALSVESLVNKALLEKPESPGPLNPQMLAIKALTNMRDLSPHYLRRFVTYMDTLLWIEQASPKSATAKPAKKKTSRN